VKEIEGAGGKAIAIQADAADPKGSERPRSGEDSPPPSAGLDVLVNNAGTAFPKPFEEATLEEMTA